MLIYGMGEQPLKELVHRMKKGEKMGEINDIPQTAFLRPSHQVPQNRFNEEAVLFSHEECLNDKKKQAQNFRVVEEQSNRLTAARILQQVGRSTLVVNPPSPPKMEEEIDASFDLPTPACRTPSIKRKRSRPTR